MDMKEIDRRIKRGVRNIRISPLFEAKKIYDMETELENPNGLLAPEVDHCWITWQSKWQDEDGNEHWGNEAYSFKTLEDAEQARKHLEKHLI